MEITDNAFSDNAAHEEKIMLDLGYDARYLKRTKFNEAAKEPSNVYRLRLNLTFSGFSKETVTSD